jgi:urea transport system substrate-binding protein
MSAPQTQAGCPPQPRLARLLDASLPPDEAAELFRHVAGCAACRRVLDTLRGDTEVVPPTESPPTQAMPSLAQPDHYPFLAPAELPDEIGRLGPYRVKRVLGEGGMGLVFEAEDPALERRVALKVMRPDVAADAAFRTRFVREAKASAAVTHDHIAAVYQAGEAANAVGGPPVPFLAMQFLTGETLLERLRRDGPLPPAEVARIGRETAEGLAAAHEKGLIHRDIKPANLWLEAPKGRVKLLDFGLARAASRDTSLTEKGLVVGTPQYLSPEQARGQDLDARSDLFALGVVLYQCLTGKFPFDGRDTLAVLTALAVDEPEPLERAAPQTPPELVALVRGLLAKNRADRPASAREVADHLAALTGPDSGLTPTRLVPRSVPPRRRLVWLAGAAAVALAATAAVLALRPTTPASPAAAAAPIRVGVLHSQTGPMAASELPVIDATLMAIEELNAAGGVLGRRLEPVVVDGASEPRTFLRGAERLIGDEKASVVFGCWTSASRKTVVPVFEREDHLLVYPVQYEGLEQSPNVLYAGAAPNQQIVPAVEWLLRQGKRKPYLVGSDYVFPHTANAIIRDTLRNTPGVTVIDEQYLPLAATDSEVTLMAKRIAAAQPDCILSTVNGDANIRLFRELRAAGVTSEAVPTVSFSLGESDLPALGPAAAGDYAAWNYFQAIDSPANANFLARLAAYRQARRRPVPPASDPMASAYEGVHLWARAAAAAGSPEPAAVRPHLGGQSFDGPEGRVKVDAATRHLWKAFRLGRVAAGGGRFELVPTDEAPIRPEPFLRSRDRAAWEGFLKKLHAEWGGWEAPRR